MPSSILTILIEVNLAAASAIALTLVLRKPVRQRLGAHAAYALWALVPVAMLATLIPARTAAPLVLPPSDAPAATFEITAALQPASATSPDPITLILWSWIIGVLVLVAWMGVGQFRFQRAWKSGTAGPAILGVLRPRIVTPANFDTHYTQPERDLILAHEMVHLARHDSRINALAAILRCACWFNPFIHIGAHVMRIDQELSCDAAVIARRPTERPAYAQALLKTQLAASPLPLGCYWPARTQHPLTERITMLNLPLPSARRRLAAAALVTVFAATTGLSAWALQPPQPALAIEQSDETSGPNPSPQPEPAPQPAPQSDKYTDFTGVTFDGSAPVRLSGLITKFVKADRGFYVHVADETSGKIWIVSGGEKGSKADLDAVAAKIQKMINADPVVIRGYQSSDKACSPECRANGRDITFVPN